MHPAQATSGSDELLKRLEGGASAVVPELWLLEIANGLLVRQRQKKLTAAERKTALATLAALNFIVDTDAGKAAFKATSEMAEKHGLSVYDATYLEVALRRSLPLASRDGSLLRAAKRSGVKLL